MASEQRGYIKIDIKLVEACYDDDRECLILILQMEARTGDRVAIELVSASHSVGEWELPAMIEALRGVYAEVPGHRWN